VTGADYGDLRYQDGADNAAAGRFRDGHGEILITATVPSSAWGSGTPLLAASAKIQDGGRASIAPARSPGASATRTIDSPGIAVSGSFPGAAWPVPGALVLAVRQAVEQGAGDRAVVDRGRDISGEPGVRGGQQPVDGGGLPGPGIPPGSIWGERRRTGVAGLALITARSPAAASSGVAGDGARGDPCPPCVGELAACRVLDVVDRLLSATIAPFHHQLSIPEFENRQVFAHLPRNRSSERLTSTSTALLRTPAAAP